MKGNIMKVIEKGNWDNPWSMEIRCCESSCGAKLLVEEDDVKPTYNCGSKYYCICMICGKSISLVHTDIPLRVKEVVDKKRKYSSYD
jgi:hypothetical protein